MFAGEPVRDDSLGCSGIARPGKLNLMTAGRGITHSGQSPPRNPGRLHGLQLWVALSDSNRKRDPAFDHYTELPAPEPGGGQAQVLMGNPGATRSGTRSISPPVGTGIHLGGHSGLQSPTEAYWGCALVVIEGKAVLGVARLAPGNLDHLGTAMPGLSSPQRIGRTSSLSLALRSASRS